MFTTALVPLIILSTLAAAIPRGPPYIACPGANQNPTGQGYAKFTGAAGHWQGDEWTAVWTDIAQDYTTHTSFECSDACWNAGPSCRGINYWHDNQVCTLFKNWYMKFVEGRSDRHVDTAIKGSCEQHAPKMYKDHPHITCCNVWM